MVLLGKTAVLLDFVQRGGGALPKFCAHFSQTLYIGSIWGWGGRGTPLPKWYKLSKFWGGGGRGYLDKIQKNSYFFFGKPSLTDWAWFLQEELRYPGSMEDTSENKRISTPTSSVTQDVNAPPSLDTRQVSFLASLDFKLSVSRSGMFLQLAHIRVFQSYS